MQSQSIGAVLTALWVAVACASGDRGVAPPLERIWPDTGGHRVVLTGQGITPSTANLVTELEPGRFLVVQRVDPEVWEYTWSAEGEVTGRRVHAFPSERARIVDIAAGRDAAAVLVVPNTVVVFDPTTWHRRGFIVLDLGPGERPGELARSDSGWVVLTEQFDAARGVRLRAVLHLTEDLSTVRRIALPSGRSSEDPAGFFDASALSAARGVPLVSGAYPPRIVRLDLARDSVRTLSLVNAPRRGYSARARQAFERRAREFPRQLRRVTRLPSHNPAVLSAAAFGAAYLVEYLAEGASGETRGVDLYCLGRFARTVLQREDVLDITLLSTAIVARRAPSDNVFEVLEFIAYDQLETSCS